MLNWIKSLFGREQISEQNEDIVKSKNSDYYDNSNAQLQVEEEKTESSSANENGDVDEFVAMLLVSSFPKEHIQLLDNSTIMHKLNTVYVEPNNIKIICEVLDVQQINEVLFFKFRFTTELPNGQTFIEELHSQNKSEFPAIFEGVVNFCEGFLKTFLFSYSEYNDPNYDVITKNGKWLLNYGLLLAAGEFQDDNFDHRHLVDILYPELLKISSDFELEYYCIKVYLGRANGKKFIGECRLNDIIWQEGLDQLVKQDFANWKTTDDILLAKKQFIFLKKVS